MKKKIYSIQQLEFKRGTKVIGTATKLVIEQITYSAFDTKAVAIYSFLQENGEIISSGSDEVPITGWVEDDHVLVENLCTILEAVIIEDITNQIIELPEPNAPIQETAPNNN